MSAPSPNSRILWYQATAFLLIIALTWLNELYNLPTRIFGNSLHNNWHESAMESFLAIAVWILLHYFTKHLLQRLRYYQEFIRICSWCRKIADENEKWVPLEEFLNSDFNAQTSHGICPQCLRENFPTQTAGTP